MANEKNYYFLPNRNEMIVNARNTKNNTLAISVAPDEMPPKPNIAAIIAMTKNTIE